MKTKYGLRLNVQRDVIMVGEALGSEPPETWRNPQRGFPLSGHKQGAKISAKNTWMKTDPENSCEAEGQDRGGH
jgi:hypothetical protein